MSDVVVGSYATLPAEEPYPGLVRRAFDAQGATVTSYTFAPGASFPLHRHVQEQITIVDAGTLTLTIGERVEEQGAGDWSVIAGGIEHGITAGPGGARITAIVVPRRSDATAIEVVA
jgi:quercetin dioxygenase-like cupin family protein